MAGTRLAIFGGEGSGRQIAHVARRADPAIELLGYLNDTEEAGAEIAGLPVLGGFEAWPALGADTVFSASLHHPHLQADRIVIVDGLGVPRKRWHTVVDPSAFVFDGVSIGVNTFISALVVLKPAISVGDHVAVRDGVSIGHDTVLEDHVFIGPNATVGGYCHIGRGAFIGMGAVIRERIRIGAMSVVGMGTVVTEDVPAGSVVVGNPPRSLRQRDAEP